MASQFGWSRFFYLYSKKSINDDGRFKFLKWFKTWGDGIWDIIMPDVAW